MNLESASRPELSLTPEQDARAVALHNESIVVDSLNCGPMNFGEEATREIQSWVDGGVSTADILERTDVLTTRLLKDGGMPERRRAWQDSGVDVVSNTYGPFGPKMFTRDNAIRHIARQHRQFVEVDFLEPIHSAADIRRVHAEGQRGIIINFQNATHIEDDLSNLDLFYDMGLRQMQVTYNDRNLLGDGCTERNPAGLSHFGLRVIKRMNELGIAVDMSHSSHPTTLDAIRASERPVIHSHSLAQAVHPHARAKNDEVLDAIAENGGYFGIVVVPFFITADSEATLAHLLAHVDHVVKRIGPEHVGFGTDWGPPIPPPLIPRMDVETKRLNFRAEDRVEWSATIAGFESFDRWPNITRALVAAGYSDEEIRGFLGENFLRVFEQAVG